MVDIAADEKARDFMRTTSQQTKIPQLFIDGKYRGGYDEFCEANECGTLQEFLCVTAAEPEQQTIS